ncbi:unnamed protein product [Polarella glacialis]|uniref:Uncharacterized protein n=1 Tax=Polarella glacialis TaxID=89957 RepID=A0A813LRQ7_POLGL|nr:unnamed protein product [Polarella glacialis]
MNPGSAMGDDCPTAAAGMAALRQQGNTLMREGDAAGAAERYERALVLAGLVLAGSYEVGEDPESYAANRAALLGNLSAARLAEGVPGSALLALEAAQLSAKADCRYAKAFFRQAKALLALQRPQEAVNAARTLLFVMGEEAALADVKALLREAADLASSRSACRGGARPPVSCSSSAPACALEAAPEVPALLSAYCGAEELARLACCSRRVAAEMATEAAFSARAAQLCPGGHAAWLRLDLLGAGPGSGGVFASGSGWLYAARREAARAGVQNRIAVCQVDGRVGLYEPVPGGGSVTQICIPALQCLPFSLCWGPGSEFLAFTALSPSFSGYTALVLAPVTSSGLSPVVVPLRKGLAPYYLSPSPCGTRVALLGALAQRQVLFVADASQVSSTNGEQASPVSLRSLGTAAPLYFDWAPHGPELLLACYGRELVRVRADVDSEADGSAPGSAGLTPWEPASEDLPESGFEAAPSSVIKGRIAFQAPQWLAWPGSSEGRWLVPRDHPDGRRVSLALVDPTTGSADILCEHLPPQTQFTASRCGQWVAWSGMHDGQGHGGVFARRLLPALGPPTMVFNGAAEAMTWGGTRLGLLLRSPASGPGSLVWAVWDPACLEPLSSESVDGFGDASSERSCLWVAPEDFVPHHSFAGRVLPFFDQFERRLRFWSPGNDAIVFTTSDAEVWVQPFPASRSRASEWSDGEISTSRHPLSSLVGAAEYTRVAPPAYRIARGSYACWSPG